ncbi:MAG: hypothetical protein DLD55_03905 [candidate division SR1 bacterium]|nr:MAG: hypothetical protein DLD55_03905 [candidate division SR1 bacterium]
MKKKSVLILLLGLFIGLNSYAYDNYSKEACNDTGDVNRKILCNEATYFYRFSDIESTPEKDQKKHNKKIPFAPRYNEVFSFLSGGKAFLSNPQVKKIQSIVSHMLATSQNPTQTMHALKTFFINSIQSSPSEFFRDIAVFYHSKLGLHPKQSKITLDDLIELIKKVFNACIVGVGFCEVASIWDTIDGIFLRSRFNIGTSPSEFFRDIAVFYHSKLGLHPKQSKITLDDLFEEFQKYDTGIQRREGDFHTYDHYGWLGYISAMPTVQYGIGKYLFSIAVAYSDSWNWTVPKTSNKYDYNGLRVLKEGDTHWQEIAKITYEDKFNFDTAKIIRLVDNKLQLYILTDYFSKSHLLGQYELQSDGNWNLNGCIKITTKDTICSDVYTLFYDNLEVSYDCEGNKMKIEKRPIKECANLGIHIQTTINK